MNERKTALDILYRVFHEDAYASLLLKKETEGNIAFVSHLVYGVIRNRTYLEYQWKQYAKHTKLKNTLIIDIGVYQLFFMDQKEYAAINETVELANQNDRNFVNAILRRVQKEGRKDSTDLSVQYSHPQWMIDMWNAHYGKEVTEKILQADQKIPQVYGRINPLKMTKERLQQDPSVHFIDDFSFTMDAPLQHSSYFQNGEVLIQNPSSLCPCFALDVKDDMKVLDCCGAPGTKTQLLGALMHNTGKITACDLYEQRVKLIEDLMVKCNTGNVETKVCDASVPSFEEESFERILCDVPCSGLGDLSHKPEIRWHLKPEDIDSITQIQEKILNNVSTYLKKEGILVYSTCTLNRKENTSQIKKFLNTHEDFSLLEEKTIFPFEKNHDGFYIAKLVKR